MATNDIPDSGAGIDWLGINMLAGLNSLGLELGISQVTPTAFSAALADFSACDSAFAAFRSQKKAAEGTWIAAAEALEDWLKVVRTVLAGRFGNRWSTEWAEAGFIDNSASVPDTREGQARLAQALIAFFMAHPTYEVGGMLVTAARGTTLRNAALAAFQAVVEVDVNKDAQWATRDASRAALVALMRTVINVLRGTLPRNDPRWLAFGLNIPAARTTPGAPVNVTAGLDAPSGKIVVSCDAVPLAQRYRWRSRVAGSGTAFDLVGRSTGPSALLAPVEPGTELEIIVQAVNGGSQGVASVPVFFTMPLAAATAAAAAPKTAGGKYGHAKDAPEPGSGNGNGRALTAHA